MPPAPAPSPARLDLARIGRGLPFAAAVEPLGCALRAGACVVQAPPGTGKTTLVPPAVANAVGGRVVVVAPRRVAARAAARRLTSLTSTRVGDVIGYTVRGERRPGSLIEVVTPGVLLRRLLADPGLVGTSAVVLDEVHERGLETDLLVGMLAEVRELREDLALVLMSATLDAQRFAGLLGGAPVVDCPAALHPLTVTWAPAPGRRVDERGVTRSFLDHVAAVAADAAARTRDDALVFVPGAHEVAVVASRLRALAPHADVLELHGRAAPDAQDRAVGGRAPGDPQRVVVTTSLAESSLTVPGVQLVIDSGLAREPRRDSVREMTGLVTVSASRASAEQRAGRAARQGPGEVVRCYAESDWAQMTPFATPEVATSDLTGACLALACWGSPRGEGLALPTPLPAGAVADAEAVLRGLGAVDADGRVTDEGRALARVPADPRLARGLLDGAALVGPEAAADVVALLADDPSGDLAAQLRTPSAARRDEARRLAALAPASGARHPDPLGVVVALTYPGRVARRDGGSYLLASGTRAGLPAGSPLTGREWLAVAEVTRAAGAAAAGTGAVIRAAAPVDLDTILLAASHLHTRELRVAFVDGRVQARQVEAVGAIELTATPVRATVAQAHPAVVAALQAEGLGVVGWSDGAAALRRRLAFLHHHLGAPWPDVSDAALLDRLDEWLGPEVDALAGGASARSVSLEEPLRRLLPWPQAGRLDELAPPRLTVPSGSAVRIDYPEDPGDRPVVAVKLQECFGWARTPRLADGRVPVLFHLLSPARRPLAVTDDLASFWSGPYAQVRAEMRGRYPRHPWPEDPWTSPATARTTPRS